MSRGEYKYHKYPKKFNRFNPPESKDYQKLSRMMGLEWESKNTPQNTHEQTDFYCHDCDNYIKDCWSQLVKRRLGKGCPHCYSRGKSVRSGWDKIVARANEVGLMVDTVGVAPTSKEKIPCQCKKCGAMSRQRYNRFVDCWECRDKSNLVRLTAKDYHEAAASKGLVWKGNKPVTQYTLTPFYCPKCKETVLWNYRGVLNSHYRRCCGQFGIVNGKKTSSMQREVARMAKAELNYKIGKHYVDCYLKESNIAIEYDSWYWHSHKSINDRRRNANILRTGCKLLTIRSSRIIPTRPQLDYALNQLRFTDRTHYRMRLKDWGVGATFS